MTKRTVAKTRAHSKPRTEKPVDSEIRRAAKRAGIAERTAAPSTPVVEPEAPPQKRGPRSILRSDYILPDYFRDRLSNLLTGGLFTCNDEAGDPITAMIHLGAVQARILAVAVAHHDSDLNAECGRKDWVLDDGSLSRTDLVTALHALSVFLSDGRSVCEELLSNGDFRTSLEREDYLKELAEREKQAKAGGAS